MPIRPRFGGPKHAPQYYNHINSIISRLRETSTLAKICQALTDAGYLSPTGLVWNISRLSNYCRMKGL
jgi:hypothetical protein